MKRNPSQPDSSVPKSGAASESNLADFAGLVSDLLHDFRTPLGSIVGAASTLDDYADHIDPETRSSLCAGIVDQAQRLDHLLTGLAAIARARRGLLVREESRVEINELLRGLSAKASERHGRRIGISGQQGEIFLNTDPAVLQTLVFAMLALACGLSQDGGSVDLALSEAGGAAVLELTSDVCCENRLRLGHLLRSAPPRAKSKRRAGTDTVFLAAIGEVVHSLGGELSILSFDGETRLRQTVKLPTQ